MPGMQYYTPPTQSEFTYLANDIAKQVMDLRPARQALGEQYSKTGRNRHRMAYKGKLEEDLAALGVQWNRLLPYLPPLDQSDVQRPSDFGPIARDEETRTYPIICPYCLAKFRVEDLLFRADVSGDGESDNSFGYEEDKEYASFWRGRLHVEDADAMRPHILSPEVEKHEIAGVVFEKKDGSQSEMCTYDEYVKNYMRFVRVVYISDCYGNQTHQRICPYCHTELPASVGFVPNYIFTLVGNSGCGKTVYLNRLVLSLTGGMLNGYLGSVVNDESATDEYSVQSQAKKVFAQNGEPMSTATDKVYIRPVIIELTNMTNAEKHFYVTIFDFPGEALWDPGDFKQLALNNFTNSFGWLVMFDSGTLDFVRRKLPENLRPQAAGNVNENMVNKSPFEILSAIRKVFCHDAQFVKPVAFVLSKADLLREAAPSLQGTVMTGDMDFLHPAHQMGKADLSDMCRCDSEIRSLMADTNVPQMGDMLCRHNCSWFAFSAVNVPVVDGVIPQGAMVSGLRELQPLEWLLYRWGQLDSFCDAESVQKVLKWGMELQVEPTIFANLNTLKYNLLSEIKSVKQALDALA